MSSRASRYFTFSLLAFLASFVLLPSSKAVNNFYYIFLASPAILLILSGKAPRPQITVLVGLWAAFFGWLALSGAGSSAHFFKYLLFTLLFFVIGWLWLDWRRFEKIWLFQFFFWMLILYVTSSAVFYWLTGQLVVGVRVLELPSRMQEPILTSIVIVSCFALLLPGWLINQRWMVIAAASLAILFCVGYVLQSRSGIVGLAVLLAIVYGRAVWWGGWSLRGVSVLIAALLSLVAIWLFHNNEVAAALIVRADSGRFELWQGYLQEWINCGLVLGCGPDFKPEIQIESGLLIEHPHNIFLAIGFRYGVPGLLLFITVMLLTLWRSWEQKNSWGGYLFVALFMLNFDGRELVNSPHEVWLLVLLPAMLIVARERDSCRKKAIVNVAH